MSADKRVGFKPAATNASGPATESVEQNLQQVVHPDGTARRE